MTRQEMIDLLGWHHRTITDEQQDTLSRVEYIVELAVRRERNADVAEQAAELRRLHEENQRCKQVCAATAEWWRVERDALLGVLTNIERSTYDAGTAALARAAVAKVEGNT